MTTTTALVNPYWEKLTHAVTQEQIWGGPVVDTYRHLIDPAAPRVEGDRFALCDRYAWTITDPDTVAFVAEHAGARLVDPLAGSGYWLHLLRQLGVDVIGYGPGSRPETLSRSAGRKARR